MRHPAPSLAAITPSVASSPTFFSIASGPPPHRRAPKDFSGAPPLRHLTTPPTHLRVAFEPHFAPLLHEAGLLAFLPQAAARARPVVRLPGRDGLRQRLAIHPREREHVVGRRLLRDRGNEAVLVPFPLFQPVLRH